jgi:hypothetical protein
MAMTPNTGAQSMVQWVASFGTPTEFWGRFSLYLTASPSAVLPVMVARDATNAANASLLRISLARVPSVGSNATIVAFTSVIPTATWVRFEFHGLVGGGGTTVTTDANYYASVDSTVITETQTTGAVAQTTATYGAVRWGANLAQTSTFYMDDLQVNGTGYPGPPQFGRQKHLGMSQAVNRAAIY